MRKIKPTACTFIGHGRLWGAPRELEVWVYELIERLITERAATIFYCGGMGEFDLLCGSAVRQLKKEYPIRLYLVIPYLTRGISDNGEYYFGLYDDIFIPPGLVGANYKAAIGLRNRWMIDNSNFAVCYVKENTGGAYKSFVYAKKRETELFNFFELADSNKKQPYVDKNTTSGIWTV